MPTPIIGVFDSGFGGLTVLRELLPLIPGAHYIYLGDTARLPYGSKSQATIARYAVESARFLLDRGAETLVIACNTATALALPEIRSAASGISVVGVIDPGVSAAQVSAESIPNPHVLVLATTATVESHAYQQALRSKDLVATEKACPLLVPLIEEGWVDHPVTRDVLRIYLREAQSVCTPQAVILGCTHYPLIAPLVREILLELGSPAIVVDSARATAEAVALHIGRMPAFPVARATFECFATDSVAKFARLGSQFLGQPIAHIALLDLGG